MPGGEHPAGGRGAGRGPAPCPAVSTQPAGAGPAEVRPASRPAGRDGAAAVALYRAAVGATEGNRLRADGAGVVAAAKLQGAHPAGGCRLPQPCRGPPGRGLPGCPSPAGARPAGAHDPVGLDVAPSMTVGEKVRPAVLEGRLLPQEGLADAAALPTTDPTTPGRLFLPPSWPCADHKGYGLALVMEASCVGLGTTEPAQARDWGSSVR